MTFPRLSAIVMLGLVSVAMARPAAAQIYVWNDTNGNRVLSNTKPGHSNFKTYTVPGTGGRAWATRPVDDGYARSFDKLIEWYSAVNQVRSDLVRAVIQVESGFNPRARSLKGAMGLMQLMPGTALEWGVLNAYDPEENIRAGVGYLRTLLDRYNNDESLALAAYNAGPNAVEKYGNAVPPYRETRDYVGRVQNISPQAGAALATAYPQSPLADAAAKARAASPKAAARTVAPNHGVRIIYKTVVIGSDGQPTPRYSDSRPPSGDFEVYSYRR